MNDDGRILLLCLGLTILALMLIGWFTSIQQVHLDRLVLTGIGDRAALSAASLGHPLEGFAVSQAQIAAAVDAELLVNPLPSTLTDLRVEATAGGAVVVGLTAVSHPPLLSWFTHAWGGFTITTSSAAELRLAAD
ncbi:MAG: hypothetical protein FWG11_09520 [Promicromonosporaceae bacterium]|nr:hypothetical protein [Promicromonosporaceae bacterium]